MALTAADQQGFAPNWAGSNSVGYEVTDKDGASYWLKPLEEPPQRTSLQLDWSRSDRVRLHGSKAVADVETAAGLQVVVADLAVASVAHPSWSPKGDQIILERYDQLANICRGFALGVRMGPTQDSPCFDRAHIPPT